MDSWPQANEALDAKIPGTRRVRTNGPARSMERIFGSRPICAKPETGELVAKKCLVNLKGGSKQERKKSGHGKGSYLRRYTETLLRVWRVPERGVCLFKM